MSRRNLVSFPLILATLTIGLVVFTMDYANATVCANCHVMHASQAGDDTLTARASLLDNTCIGCHSGDSSDGPSVYQKSVNELSGGDFDYLTGGGANNRKGHNPVEIGIVEDVVGYTDPPGWVNSGFPDPDGTLVADAWVLGTTLTCAGASGCHGKHSETDSLRSLDGAHHKNLNGATTGLATVGNSFRFLYGIKGYEDDDWEEETAVDRNVYYGENRSGSADTSASNTQSISYLCAQCHGNFHSGAGTLGVINGGAMGTNPWLRHPVDFGMSNVDEYADYSVYRVDVPVASTTVQNSAAHDGDMTNVDNRIVMCLSCHRAHASNYPSILRWDASLVSAGAGSSTVGCFACHTTTDI